MILGIDAASIAGSGCLTHLVELLRAVDPGLHGFSRVIVWSGKATLNRIEDRPWLVKSHQPMLDKSLPYRVFWQRFSLSRLARMAGCDVLFVPNGSYAGDFYPMVTMSRNMLPFEWRELLRFGFSLMMLKCLFQRWTLSCSFRLAQGVIFLTQYAKVTVLQAIKSTTARTEIIPHGVNERFINPPREQRPISHYSVEQPFRILYVSTIYAYKHQCRAAEAVAQLRKSGFPVFLDLVGPAYSPDLAQLKKTLDRVDPDGKCVLYSGIVHHDELPAIYARANLCLFASSCENMPNILLEGMASGLPIACSNRGPMPEVLCDTGVYFDPENPNEIARALRELIGSHELRARLAKASFERAQIYSWERCARETFEFLANVATDFKASF